MTTTARPRVMHVITHLALGGAEAVAMRLIETLRDRADFAMFAVIDEKGPNPIGQRMADRLTAWRVPAITGTDRGFKSGGVFLAALALACAMRRLRPAVVHLHTEIPELTWAVASLLSSRVRRTPVLRTVHNSEVWIAWGGVGRWVTRRLANAAAVACSRSAADADMAIDVPGRARAEILFNGVPVPRNRSRPHGQGPIRILFAGRFVPQKGADLLPAILARAEQLAPDRNVHVTVAGHGSGRQALAAGFAASSIGWPIDLVAPLPDLPERIADFDVVLMPSRFEGFGLMAIEALFAGVPVVVSRAPGLDETIPTDYPLLADSEDIDGFAAALARVVIDPETYRRHAVGMRDALAGRFSLEAMADAYASHYARLARRGEK